MNFIDLVFILILIGVIALGFFKGMIRIGVLLMAFYLSVVLGSLYYPVVGNFLYTNFGGEAFASDYMGFLFVTVLSFALLTAAGLYTFRYAEMPGKLFYVDKIIGLLLALVLAGLILGVLASLLWQLFIISGGRNIDFALFRMIGDSVYDSFLLTYFSQYILPEIYDIVDPFLPDGASFLFEI